MIALSHEIRAERLRARRERVSRERRAFVYNLKSVPCVDCTVRYPHYVMDFDHRPGAVKVGDIAFLMMRASRSTILAEVAKCDIVCSNCHRLRTWSKLKRSARSASYDARRLLLDRLKSRPCEDCKRRYHPCVMDFDHRPGELKLECVGRLMGVALHRLLAEVAKCDLICSNCHRKRTHRRKT